MWLWTRHGHDPAEAKEGWRHGVSCARGHTVPLSRDAAHPCMPLVAHERGEACDARPHRGGPVLGAGRATAHRRAAEVAPYRRFSHHRPRGRARPALGQPQGPAVERPVLERGPGRVSGLRVLLVAGVGDARPRAGALVRRPRPDVSLAPPHRHRRLSPARRACGPGHDGGEPGREPGRRRAGCAGAGRALGARGRLPGAHRAPHPARVRAVVAHPSGDWPVRCCGRPPCCG